MNSQQAHILKQLRTIRSDLLCIGWDLQADKIEDIVQDLEHQIEQMDKFHQIHPRNIRGQFTPREILDDHL